MKMISCCVQRAKTTWKSSVFFLKKQEWIKKILCHLDLWDIRKYDRR